MGWRHDAGSRSDGFNPTVSNEYGWVGPTLGKSPGERGQLGDSALAEFSLAFWHVVLLRMAGCYVNGVSLKHQSHCRLGKWWLAHLAPSLFWGASDVICLKLCLIKHPVHKYYKFRLENIDLAVVSCSWSLRNKTTLEEPGRDTNRKRKKKPLRLSLRWCPQTAESTWRAAGFHSITNGKTQKIFWLFLNLTNRYLYTNRWSGSERADESFESAVCDGGGASSRAVVGGLGVDGELLT